MDIGKYETFLFDFDGTLWDGRTAYPEVPELLRELFSRQRKIAVISNNSQLSGDEISALLHQETGIAGICAVTIVDIVAQELRSRFPDARVISVLGSGALTAACIDGGFEVCDVDDERNEAVLLGCYAGFRYEDITRVARAGTRGIPLVATNADGSRPGPDHGRIPETGALVAAIAQVHSGSWIFLGKPNPALFEYGLRQVDARPSSSLMIGDGAETDIPGARELGMETLWIGHQNAPERDDRHAATCSIQHLGQLLSAVKSGELVETPTQ